MSHDAGSGAGGAVGQPDSGRRGRWLRPEPEEVGFGRRFIAATSFGSVLNPVNSSIIAVARSPLWLLLAVSVVCGAQNGLNVVTNQAAMYAQAPADSTGAAAGMLRTFMYLGAIGSASLIRLALGRVATDAGLHHLAVILTVAAAVLLAVTLADRNPAPHDERSRHG
jgi:MFS family permease